jgi:NAD(P)-dependent dehydrogenase (short-subunit alcohol dehydrogenase family)
MHFESTLVGWSKSMANEIGGDGVTFNMLLPGRIETARLKELDAANAERSGKSLEDVTAAANRRSLWAAMARSKSSRQRLHSWLAPRRATSTDR